MTIKTDYRTLGGTQSLVDALIAGQMNFGITGVPGLATLWDKTAGTQGKCGAVRRAGDAFILTTNRPEVKTIKDFREGDKIAVPGSELQQAICLQMAAEGMGPGAIARLDPLTITLPHRTPRSRSSPSRPRSPAHGVAPFQNTNWRRRACTRC